MTLELAGLVQRFGSPLFVYDADVIRSRYRALREALPPSCAVHFAAKANPSLGILALLRSLGAGVEVASRGELLAALRAGFEASRILWAGPAKTDAELELAAETAIHAVHAESPAEILRLDAIGRRRGKPVDAGLRVHVPWSAGEATRIIGGAAPGKFGIEEGEALRLAPEWARLEGVRLRSVHVFSASNVRDARALADSWAGTLRLASRLRKLGLPVDHVDLGGGLGVPYADGEASLDVAELGSLLAEHLQSLAATDGFEPRVAIEPGRFLVAESGLYVMTVVARKASGGIPWLTCDGGVHHLLRPALVGQPHRIRAASPARGPARPHRVGGPLCTSLDDLGTHELPDLQAGDLLAVENAGAYGFTESMPLFLSHARPAEILLLDGEAHVLRPRFEAERILEDQTIPAALANPFCNGEGR